MKITVFTGNSNRHFGLVNSLIEFAEQVHAVIEISDKTRISHSAILDSPSLKQYMQHVKEAELRYFSESNELNKDVKVTKCPAGRLNDLLKIDLEEALDSDLFIVFGSSFIKGWLCDFLVDKNALNLHVGISPYYRGSACNFWAVHDGNPNFVGATWHLLTQGLDDGPILFHSRPTHEDEDVFNFTMKAVKSAQNDFNSNFENLIHKRIIPEPQDSSLEIRYSRIGNFTESIAAKFLQSDYGHENLRKSILESAQPRLIKGKFF